MKRIVNINKKIKYYQINIYQKIKKLMQMIFLIKDYKVFLYFFK